MTEQKEVFLMVFETPGPDGPIPHAIEYETEAEWRQALSKDWRPYEGMHTLYVVS